MSGIRASIDRTRGHGSGSTSGLGALVAAATAVVSLAACTPVTNSENACWAGNLQLTGEKDAPAVGRYHGGIDAPMEALMQSSGAPSCAIAVVARNRIATINRYGDPFDVAGALLDPTLPAVAQTRLYVGSISKTVTALAMLKLDEDASHGGIVVRPPVSLLDRPLAELYPPVEDIEEWANVTPRALLAHSTGTRKNPNPADDDALDDLPAAAGPYPGIHPRHAFVVYRDSDDKILPFEGNFTARYSNIGYSLVGAAIDWQTVGAVAGSQAGYERYVFQNVALRNHTTAAPAMLSMCLGTPWRAPNMDNLARGFKAGSNVPLPAPQYSGWEGPAGGWTMTIGDLGRLIIAINTNARISAASRDEMLTALSEGPISTPADWGLGVWHISVDTTERRYGKGGDIDGFTSDFIAYRDAGLGAAVVCNQDSMDHDSIRAAILDVIDPCRDLPLGERPDYCSPLGLGLGG